MNTRHPCIPVCCALSVLLGIGAISAARAQDTAGSVYLEAQVGTASWSGPSNMPQRPAGSDSGSGGLFSQWGGAGALGFVGASGWGGEVYGLGAQGVYDALSHVGAAAVYRRNLSNLQLSFKLGAGQTRVEEATPWQNPSKVSEQKTDASLGLEASVPWGERLAWSSQVRYLSRSKALSLSTGLRWAL